ncbi:MAG: TldD/PmbA family protein [Rhodospirillaceae bacterium]|nr:TldD/PmbA family protein [Rhodospirillaceae bacterium]
MTKADTFDRLSDLLKLARVAGAETADAVWVESRSMSVSQRMRQREAVERAESSDIGLRVMIGKCQAIVSSTDISSGALGELAERAVAMAKVAPEDPYCGLADETALARDWSVLDTYDETEPSPETLAEMASVAEEAALAVEGINNSEGGEAGWGENRFALVTSTGFSGSYRRSSSSVSAVVLAGEDDGMERDYDYSSKVYFADLEDPADIGRRAGERTIARLNPRKVSSQQAPVIYDPKVSRTLIGHFAGAISGSSVARGTSFLKDRMGEQILSPGITIVDDPLRARGFRSKPFDGEGIATQRREMVSSGVLNSWFLDLATARQLGLETTGNASRGTGGPPGPGATNLYCEAGSIGRDALIAEIDNGFYVTELMGMSVSTVTGDYSRGGAGFWIENGEIAYPVSELTVAGNLKDMFVNLTVADDLEFKYGTDAPTIRVDGMTIAGSG